MEKHSNSTKSQENRFSVSDITLELLEKLGALPVYHAKHTIYCLNIVGQIEGHSLLPETCKTTKYEHLLPLLAAIEQERTVEGLLILLNTVGGDVEAGLALAEMIAGMELPSVSLVLGGGHSIGVPLAVSAKQSLIVPSASMTVHPVRMNGTLMGVPQAMHCVEGMQERILQFVASHSHISRDALYALMTRTDALVMDFGSVLDGQQAVEAGLIDSVGSISDAIHALYAQIEAAQTRYP
ncbi:MAG: ClpP family protease [Oscillospiraceae bacterium]